MEHSQHLLSFSFIKINGMGYALVNAKPVIMDIINTKVHGIIDYLFGLLLIAGPWLLGFADDKTPTWMAIGFGVSTILYSLLTDYELGIFRRLDMSVHLTLDVLSGMVLLVSPWVFEFSKGLWIPFIAAGIIEIAVGGCTIVISGTDKPLYEI